MLITDNKTIIGFMNGTGKDHKGRTYFEILNWTDEQLETCHDQIQFIFPLHEASNYAETCPIISKEVIKEANVSLPIIQANLIKAKTRFERFLGVNDTNWDKINLWCTNGNHNLLRITRIIRSLRLFGLEKEALDFHIKVSEVLITKNISKLPLVFWDKALKNDKWQSLK